jgi:5-formyltetrahydrofolate cyclo-ligase
MSSLQAEKQALRVDARARRTAAFGAAAAAGDALRDAFRQSVRLRPGAVVAGYLPIGDEIDSRPLLDWLRGAGHDIALPRIQRSHAPLAFRLWAPGEPLEEGPFGTRQPPETAPEAVPGVAVLPVLAFDRRGYRLGYGGGYYDRTLAALRAERAVTAIGIAFAAQEVSAVPHDRHDQPLDWVVTEREAIRMEKKI